MSWVRIDDQASEHAKFLRLAEDDVAGPHAPDACWLWSCGLMYANRQKVKDGFIPRAKVPMLYPNIKDPAKRAENLVAVGLWDAVEGGYRIHDYHEYQLTPEQTEARRRARAEAGRIGGRRSGEARAKLVASRLLQPDEAHVEANANPDPDPDPDPKERDAPPEELRGMTTLAADAALTPKLRAIADTLAMTTGVKFDLVTEWPLYVSDRRKKGLTFADWGEDWRSWLLRDVRRRKSMGVHSRPADPPQPKSPARKLYVPPAAPAEAFTPDIPDDLLPARGVAS